MVATSAPPAPIDHWPEGLKAALTDIWATLGLPAHAAHMGRLTLFGPLPELDTTLPIAEAMAVAMAAAALTATAVGGLRGICAQNGQLTLQTALAYVHAEHMFGPTLNGRPLASRMVRDNPLLASVYRCADGPWIMPSALHPQQQLAWLRFLKVPPTPEAVAQAIAAHDALALEDAAAQAGLAAAVCRSRKTWAHHAQGRMLAQTPPITFRYRGPCSARALEPAERPLAGVRVLAFTQGVAGPVACRTLAEQGADVLHIGQPEGFEHEAVWCEAYVGCRSMGLDLRQPRHAQHVQALLAQSDVAVLSLRPSAQRALGLDQETLARQHPHLTQVRLSAYGAAGPWADRPGFDMNAMAATGMMAAEGARRADGIPALPPTTLLNDFLMGYLAAAGACAALWHGAARGRGYDVELNLARIAMWCLDTSFAGAEALPGHAGSLRVVEGATPLGVLRRLAPGVLLERTPGAWRHPWLVPRVSQPPQDDWPVVL